MKGKKKQFFSLSGKPILAHTLDVFEGCSMIDSILLVVGQEDMGRCLKEVVEKYRYKKISRIVPGGNAVKTRWRMESTPSLKTWRLLSFTTASRPFVTREMIEESIRSALRFQAVVLAMPVKETIKVADPDGTVLQTLDRNYLWQIQTPQTFQAGLIREAFRKASEDGFLGTDDASLVERLGTGVHILPGSYTNIKITTPEDLLWAALFVQERSPAEGEGFGEGGDRTDRKGKG